jgi:hypothetical protein
MRADRTTVLSVSGMILTGVVMVLAGVAVAAARTIPFVPSPHTATLVPPSQSKPGVLIRSAGEVLAMPREAADYQPATPGGTLIQGDAIATKQGTGTVSVEGVFAVTLSEGTTVELVNLDPSRTMLRQTSGTASYILSPSVTVSVRALHALIELSGDGALAMKDGMFTLALTSGTAKIALVDTDNTTHVYDLASGQKAVVDDGSRTVIIR